VKCFGEQAKLSMPCSLVKDVIFLMVDWFFELAKFESIKINIMMTKITKLFFDMWARHNVMLEVIGNECDTKFTLETWLFFMKKIGTKLEFNTTFHPQIDG
jgi:hypothetical protein